LPKMLIVMRHVQCEISGPVGRQVDGPFAPGAEQQAYRVAKHLLKIIDGKSVKLLTSDAERCIRTAKSMNEKLGCPYHETSHLNLAFQQFQDELDRFFAGKSINTYDAYIFVTHRAFVQQTIDYVTERLKYESSATRDSEIPFGSFLVIDCVDGKATLMRN